ncbi:hypothetical protein [Schleiferilactobacillus perolens]|jgi:hypothetical protein|uniref:hypothetical protein n=1 Tax=Schleiferilactobacillus perolens TaxID=100468 RepID=UPI00235617CA|nr:hypothetical protein [Schleiferilactobacillus perolens]MCI2172552.1 hypothetical protein [Schleiferilactobacillus perolens]
MKLKKVLASLMVLGGISMAGAIIAFTRVPVHAATTESPIIRLNNPTNTQTFRDDGTLNPGLTSKFTTNSAWRVTGVQMDPLAESLYLRVATNEWIYYSMLDHANAPLIKQMRATTQAYSTKQGNYGGYVTSKRPLNYLGKTVTTTPVVNRPGSTKIVRQLPAGTKWRLTAQALKPLILRTDTTDEYFQIATNQWVNMKYVALFFDFKFPLVVGNQPERVYRFDDHTLKMTATAQQLKPHTTWQNKWVYMNMAYGEIFTLNHGQTYLQVGGNEWVYSPNVKIAY